MTKTEKNTRDYVYEKLNAAVRILAEGEKGYVDRLSDAYRSQLHPLTLKKIDLGGDLGDDLNYVLDMTNRGSISHDEFKDAVSKMFHLIYEFR